MKEGKSYVLMRENTHVYPGQVAHRPAWRVRLPPALLVACFLLCGWAKAAEDPKRGPQAEAKAKVLQRQIRAELATLKDPQWAGEYYCGDGLGVNVSLLLAPQSGYVFEWHGCLGLYDRNYGAVTETNGQLRLSFTFANQRQGFQGVAEQLLPISWGKRTYLIPADAVVGFCNQVNSGAEPRKGVHGLYLLRRGDEKKQASGLPKLPPEFQTHLLKSPVTATILAVGPSTLRPSAAKFKFKDTTVTLDAGKSEGLLPGMELHVVKQKVYQSAKITKVEEHKAEAVITAIGEEEPGPQIGWKLSTRWR